MAFNEEQFIRDILGATGGKITIEKGTLNKSFEEMKEDLEKVFKPREPLFTLTAEEVELTKQALMLSKNQIIESYIRFPHIEAYLVTERDKIFKLLDRIKQWEEQRNGEA